MHKYLLLLLPVMACNCSTPTVVSRKIVSVSTTIVYQVGEDEGMSTHAAIQTAGSRLHAERIANASGNPQPVDPNKPADSPSEPTVPTSDGCAQYVYSKSYQHVEQSYQHGENKKSEDILTDESEVVCVY